MEISQQWDFHRTLGKNAFSIATAEKILTKNGLNPRPKHLQHEIFFRGLDGISDFFRSYSRIFRSWDKTDTLQRNSPISENSIRSSEKGRNSIKTSEKGLS